MKKFFAVLVLVAIIVAAVVPVLAHADTASACWEGRTPGYWKNHVDDWVGYSTGDHFVDVFGVGPDEDLLDVLTTGGGKWTAMHRHAVAALLNSTAGGYFYDTEDVIYAVQWAYDHDNWWTVKDWLETANEYGD